jgi:hypothetical protein
MGKKARAADHGYDLRPGLTVGTFKKGEKKKKMTVEPKILL